MKQKAVKIVPKYSITDHTANQLYKMAEKFFADPKNQEGFKKWHLEKYGYEYGTTKKGAKTQEQCDKSKLMPGVVRICSFFSIATLSANFIFRLFFLPQYCMNLQ